MAHDHVRSPYNESDGYCWVGRTSTSSGTVTWDEPEVLFTQFGCREYDYNGGDCHVRGTVFCR